MTVEQLETFSNTKPELRYLTEEIIKYLGANPPGAPGGDSLVLSATVEITDAEFKNLDSVAVTIIPAPGDEKAIAILSWQLVLQSTDGAYGGTGSGANPMQLYYADGAEDCSEAIELLASTTARLVYTGRGKATSALGQDLVVENKAVVLWSNLSNDMTGGNVANYLKVQVQYVVVDL